METEVSLRYFSALQPSHTGSQTPTLWRANWQQSSCPACLYGHLAKDCKALQNHAAAWLVHKRASRCAVKECQAQHTLLRTALRWWELYKGTTKQLLGEICRFPHHNINTFLQPSTYLSQHTQLWQNKKGKKKRQITFRPSETVTGAVLQTKASSKLVHLGWTGSLTTTTMVAPLSQTNITKNLP